MKVNRRKFLRGAVSALTGALMLKAEGPDSVVAPQDETQFVAIPKTQFNDDGKWRDVFYRKPRLDVGTGQTITHGNIYAGGDILVAGGITPPCKIAKWNVSSFSEQVPTPNWRHVFTGYDSTLEIRNAEGQWVEVGKVDSFG